MRIAGYQSRYPAISLCGGITMTGTINSSEKNSMIISVEGHQVALHFAREPDVQVALKVKQALLGACLPAGK